VKELRLAGATTIEEANEVLEKIFLRWFNRRDVVQPAQRAANGAARRIVIVYHPPSGRSRISYVVRPDVLGLEVGGGAAGGQAIHVCIPPRGDPYFIF